eukprot:6418002-Pyramimonas_sp.AAC.1
MMRYLLPLCAADQCAPRRERVVRAGAPPGDWGLSLAAPQRASRAPLAEMPKNGGMNSKGAPDP